MRAIAALLMVSAMALSGCTQTGSDAAGGALAGGVVGGVTGALVSGGSTAGVLIGAGVGATTGAILAANNSKPAGWCTWQDRNTGQLYYAPCPR